MFFAARGSLDSFTYKFKLYRYLRGCCYQYSWRIYFKIKIYENFTHPCNELYYNLFLSSQRKTKEKDVC